MRAPFLSLTNHPPRCETRPGGTFHIICGSTVSLLLLCTDEPEDRWLNLCHCCAVFLAGSRIQSYTSCWKQVGRLEANCRHIGPFHARMGSSFWTSLMRPSPRFGVPPEAAVSHAFHRKGDIAGTNRPSSYLHRQNRRHLLVSEQPGFL